MTQVVRTTNDVIVNSLMLIGELGVGEVADAFMLKTGLDLINELLDKFASDNIYIPYLTTITSNFNVGQDIYSISDMLPGTNITADRIVDLVFANYIVPAGGALATTTPITFNFTADSTTNLITLNAPSTSFPTGTPVTLGIGAGGVMPSPFVAGVTYYTIFVSSTQLLLAASAGNANAGIPIAILTNGSGTLTITAFQGVILNSNEPIVYPIRIISKAEFYNVVRLQNLLSRPGFMFLNKQAQESFVTVYPTPDQPYQFFIQVKSMINQLGNQDTLGELPPNYYGFLKYALARKFMGYYPSANWPQTNEDEYQDYYATLKNTNETDTTLRPSVIMTAPEPFYWPNILAY